MSSEHTFVFCLCMKDREDLSGFAEGHMQKLAMEQQMSFNLVVSL